MMRLLASAVVTALVGAACSRRTPAEPSADAGVGAGSGIRIVNSAPAIRHEHFVPPSLATGKIPPPPKREPDWGLDPSDPARDYADRYIHATNRYGPQTPCVLLSKSLFKDGRSLVDAANDPSGSCGPPGQVRETFEIDVAADRLSLVDPGHHDALLKWPDGSDPEGPPVPTIAETTDTKGWKSPLRKAFADLQLAPIRLQYYGRGSYLVVTLAGFHGVLALDSPSDTLDAFARTLCAADDNGSFGTFWGEDRADMLRVRCPDSGKWERF
jgi:hypothetical protein